MKRATARPQYASISSEKKWESSIQTSTAAVATESERLSSAVASIAGEAIFLPIRLL